jgi:hypothetical protein
MWRGLTTACSRNTVGSPNADSASRDAASIASGNSAGSVTRRIPRPPPPATALTNNGNSIVREAATNSATSADGADDVSTGNPASRAAVIALALLPVSSSTSALEPTNVISAAAHAAANSGFSERKP